MPGSLGALFGSVWIPDAVRREVEPRILPTTIQLRGIEQAINPAIRRASLGAGESEAIALALEVRASIALIDDRAARRLAGALSVRTVGTLGILLEAKHGGVVPAIRPLIDGLPSLPFHIAPTLNETVIRLAGEE